MVSDLIKFFEDVGKLKKLKRTGWMRAGVPNSESVAEHIYRVSVMSMILAKKSLNIEKVLKMSLVHDLPEAEAGDLVAERRGVIITKMKEEKEKLEREAMKKICDNLRDGKEYFDLWVEYEKGESEVAKFVRQMDRLEMALQAYEYESEHGKDLTEWFESARKAVKDPELIKIFEGIIKKRK